MKLGLKIIIIFVLLILVPLNVFSLTYPDFNSSKVIVYDKTDKNILYEKNSDDVTSIASLTKIATTITALEKINNIRDTVEITEEMLNKVSPEASVAGLKVGDKLTYQDLLYASILPSGADATISLAISISGSVSDFVALMNNLADKLNLKNTHFVNVTGLDEEGHQSSASEVLKLLDYALDNKIFREIYMTKDYTLSNGLNVKSTIYKYANGYNLDISKILGSKTGYTYDAGYCMSALANDDNHDIIIIVLGAPYKEKIPYHVMDIINIEDFVSKSYNIQTLYNKDDIIKEIPVKLSRTNSYQIKTNNDVLKYLPDDYDKNLVTIKYDGLDKLSFKNKKGSKIGTINYYYNDELITSEDEILTDNIDLNFLVLLKSYWFILVALCLIIILIRYPKK